MSRLKNGKMQRACCRDRPRRAHSSATPTPSADERSASTSCSAAGGRGASGGRSSGSRRRNRRRRTPRSRSRRSRCRRWSGSPRAASAPARTTMISSPPIVGVPALARCVCGPSCRITWPIWKSRSRRISERPEHQAQRQRRHARAGGAERDVAEHVQHRELAGGAGRRAGGTASGELRLQPIDDDVGADAARALHQHEIAGTDVLQRDARRLRRWSAAWTTAARACRRHAPRRPAARAAIAADRDQQLEPARGRGAAAFFVQARRRARRARASRRAPRSCARCPWPRAIVSSDFLSAAGLELYESSISVMPPGRRSSSPRCDAGLHRRGALGDLVGRHAHLHRHGRRGEQVEQVARAEERRFDRERAGRRRSRSRPCPRGRDAARHWRAHELGPISRKSGSGLRTTGARD